MSDNKPKVQWILMEVLDVDLQRVEARLQTFLVCVLVKSKGARVWDVSLRLRRPEIKGLLEVDC